MQQCVGGTCAGSSIQGGDPSGPLTDWQPFHRVGCSAMLVLTLELFVASVKFPKDGSVQEVKKKWNGYTLDGGVKE